MNACYHQTKSSDLDHPIRNLTTMALLSRRFLARRPRTRILIVGGNFAGLAAAKALPPDYAQVTVIDPSPYMEWLPNIHELLSRRKTSVQLQHDRRQIVERLGHEFIEEAVTRIDRATRQVLTSGGQQLDYDVLVLATGGVPCDYGIAGVNECTINTRSVASCNRISNALTRLAALPGEQPVVIVGGGIEGLEMLGEVLRRIGDKEKIDLHLIERRPQLFERFTGLHEHLVQRMGAQVTLHTGSHVQSVTHDQIYVDNGQALPTRLTIWTAGSHGHPLLTDTGLSQASQDAPVNSGLQSLYDNAIFVIGDAARLPAPLEKQAFHAQDMGRHVANSIRDHLAGRPLTNFRPRQKPSLVSFGNRDAFMFLGNRVLASPTLLGLKEAVYQYGYHDILPPRSRHELSALVRDLRHGVNTLDTWRLLIGSTEARLFQAR